MSLRSLPDVTVDRPDEGRHRARKRNLALRVGLLQRQGGDRLELLLERKIDRRCLLSRELVELGDGRAGRGEHDARELALALPLREHRHRRSGRHVEKNVEPLPLRQREARPPDRLHRIAVGRDHLALHRAKVDPK